jgi:hypothetical protein
MEMKILNDLLNTLRQGEIVKDIRQGPFQTAVLTYNCGLASTLYDYGYHHGNAPVKEAGRLVGKEALEIAQMVYSPGLFEAAIGMAAINSLLEVDEGHCLSLNAGDFIAEKGRRKALSLKPMLSVLLALPSLTILLSICLAFVVLKPMLSSSDPLLRYHLSSLITGLMPFRAQR